MITRDSLWRSGNKKIKIKNMSDAHLINVIHFVKACRDLKAPANKALVVALEIEAFHFRRLNRGFLKYAPLPFKDKEGNWAVWDYENWGLKSLSDKNLDNPVGAEMEIEDLDDYDNEIDNIIVDLKNIVNFNNCAK